MTIIGIDDTDSREYGMCTTYVGHLIATQLEDNGSVVDSIRLIRLNPAAKHKTRGNAAVAIHTDASPEKAFEIAKDEVFANSATEDDETNPGVVVCPDDVVSSRVQQFTMRAIRELLDIKDAIEIISDEKYLSDYDGNGRGRIGSLAAIGSAFTLHDWTYEYISYRNLDRCGSTREVDAESVFEAANTYYPHAWDTVDRVQGDLVCVPHTPCPILYAIRGDDFKSVQSLAMEIDGEQVSSRQLFLTNQGTDIHLQNATIGEVENDKCYRLDGIINSNPETKKGGRVEVELTDEENNITLVAFEPTKHFRDYVRDLRVGDELTVCGEVSDGSLKLEKFAVRYLNDTKLVNPTCEDCDVRMESAGANQGYRCRKCSNTASKKIEIPVERKLDCGWYEVPPCARRHIAKPLVRGGFDDKVNPEQ